MRANEVIHKQRTISRHGEASRLPFNAEEQRRISGQFQNEDSLTRNLLLTAVYETDQGIQEEAAMALRGAGQEVVQELFRLCEESSNDVIARRNIANTIKVIAQADGLGKENLLNLERALEMEIDGTVVQPLLYALVSAH